MAAYLGGLALCMVAITGWVEGQLAADAQRLAERNAYWEEVLK
jgi:hypothetical protein